MADNSKIEIIENTLLKLLIRRGTNADRLNVILNTGELGYTTDTKKLFIGDGSTAGGVLVTGTKFLGATGDLTSLSPGDVNDLGFNTTTNTLYYIAQNDGSSVADWTAIAGLYSNSDGTITIEADNNVVLGAADGAGLTKDGDNKLEIDTAIATDQISPKTATYLSMPQRTAFGDVNYTFPTAGAINTYLRLDAGGNLSWAAFGGTSNTFVNEEIVPVGTIVPYADSTLPAGGKWLQCDGSTVSQTTYAALYAILGTTYGSDAGGNFTLPDIRGKVIVGFTNSTVYDLSGNGETFTLAITGGEYVHALDESEIPSHTHTLSTGPVGNTGDLGGTSGVLGVVDSSSIVAGVTSPSLEALVTGGGLAHANMQPYIAVTYMIKALPDAIADCNITLTDGLTASEAIDGVVTEINPLSGEYELGLGSVIEAKDLGYINVGSKGLVTSYDTSSAGDTSTIDPQGTEVTHSFGFLNFLYEPVPIASVSLFGSVPNDWGKEIQVYPNIVTVDGAAVAPPQSIPSYAKNVILQSAVVGSSDDDAYVYASLHSGLSGTGTTRGTNEYLVNVARGAGSRRTGSMQIVIPLSANSNNDTLSFHMRGDTRTVEKLDIEIIGWTL